MLTLCPPIRLTTWKAKLQFNKMKGQRKKVVAAGIIDIINMQFVHTENTHLLCKGKYHCTAELLFDWLVFGQTSKSVYNFNSTKQVNPN